MRSDIYMDKRLLRRFAREVILQKDTPSLILVLAGNLRYLILCHEHGIDLEWLKDRLAPSAKALGLQMESVAQLDYYAILGIDKDADLSKIKTAYRKKAHLTHPDIKSPHTDDNKAFIEIMI